MSEFGWTRLAYLSVILAVLAILVKLGTFGASSISENFPESALAFAQREPISEEHLDWESRAAGDSETARIKERHSGDDHSDGDSEDEHSDGAGRSDDEHSESGDRGHSHEPVESIYENVNFEEDAPVFFRPTPRVSGASMEPSPDAKSCQTVGDAPPGSEILFPLAREYFDSYDDTWGAARPQGGHEGTDLMAPMGTPEFAITDGTVVPVSGANTNGWNTLGGYTVMIEAAYSVGPVKKGDLFYYAHMDRKSELAIGDTVKAGDVVGYAGDTGQGPEGTRGQFPPHLHLGWYETSGERTQLASGAMNPYPLLEWVKANGGSIEGGSDIPYCEAPQSSAPTPSGGGYWQFPSDPGVRPDMSTETDDASPSPVARQNASAESSPDVTREPRRPARPDRSDRPADSAPPREDGSSREPTTPEPPRNGATSRPPSFPDIPNPLPGIGDEIGEIIDGVLNPRPSKPPKNNETTGPTAPTPPPEETTSPPKPTNPAPPPEETTPGDDPPEDTPPGDTPPGDAPPEDAPPEEDDECEARDRDGGTDEGDTGEETRDRGVEECPEETNPENETNSEEEAPPSGEDGDAVEDTTGSSPPEAVEDQYEGEQPNPEAGTPERETTSGP